MTALHSAPAPAGRDSQADRREIPVRRIDTADLRAALRRGMEDFGSKRGDLIFIGLFYPLIGIVAAWLALGNDAIPMLFPIAAGISLLGPFTALGFYELARRREAGLDARWRHFVDVYRAPGFDSALVIGALLVVLFGAWLFAAAFIYEAALGSYRPTSIPAFLETLFTTAGGWTLIVVGNLVGFVFAAAALTISLVSLPMLVDRDVGADRALRASIRAVRANPGPCFRWGLIVAGLLVLGSIPAFIGLAFVLPMLGYATWHLYGLLVDRSALPA